MNILQKKSSQKIQKKINFSKEDIHHLSKCRIIQKNLARRYSRTRQGNLRARPLATGERERPWGVRTHPAFMSF